jgi:hypothetical protein
MVDRPSAGQSFINWSKPALQLHFTMFFFFILQNIPCRFALFRGGHTN